MNQTNTFEPWELKWEEKHVQRFWDWQGRNPAKASLYFSKQVGDAILDEVNQYTQLSGTIVDWGAGPGFLIEKLLNRDLDTMAIDASVASVNLLNEKFSGKAHFLGAQVSPLEKKVTRNEFADLLFLIETVEHLDDVFLSYVLSEALRILKPEGVLVVTTPHQENLEENQVMCPNCGCVFHTVQHVRSLTPSSLVNLMENSGFHTIVCKPTLFSWFSFPLRQIHQLKYRLKGYALPHLMYIGKKK